jgi:hypothetical protein
MRALPGDTGHNRVLSAFPAFVFCGREGLCCLAAERATWIEIPKRLFLDLKRLSGE